MGWVRTKHLFPWIWIEVKKSKTLLKSEVDSHLYKLMAMEHFWSRSSAFEHLDLMLYLRIYILLGYLQRRWSIPTPQMTTVTDTRFSYETVSQYRLYWSFHSGPNQHPQPKVPYSVTQSPQIKLESLTSQLQPVNLMSADVFKCLQSFSSQESHDILSLPGVMPSVLEEVYLCRQWFQSRKTFLWSRWKGGAMSYPMVVIEVEYLESPQDLAEDCGWWVVCSLGWVCLAIGINIKYTFEKDSNGETVPESRKLTSIYCYTWDMEKIDQVSVLLGREEIDVLRRADGGHRGPASKYYCFSYLEDELYHFQSCNCHKFQVCSYSWASGLFPDNFVGVSNRSTRKVWCN